MRTSHWFIFLILKNFGFFKRHFQEILPFYLQATSILLLFPIFKEKPNFFALKTYCPTFLKNYSLIRSLLQVCINVISSLLKTFQTNHEIGKKRRF